MRKFVLYGIIFFQFMLIISLVKGIQLAIKARSRVTNLEEKKTRLTEKQNKLQDELAYVQSDYYTEKVAREELQLAKPGETVVIVPEGSHLGEKPTSPEPQTQNEPNYRKWWRVISGLE